MNMGVKGRAILPVIVGILILGSVVNQNAFSAVFIDSLDISGEDADPQDLAFNTDGTKMFVLGNAGNDVSEYACTTGFDISTCTFSVGESLPVSVQEPTPTGIAFSADGLTMFITGLFGVDVTEFACGTAFDVSTCAVTDTKSIAGQETFPQGLAFNTDGMKMFVTGSTGDDVNEYACGTAFDATSCIFTVKAGNPFSVFTQETAPQGLAFNTDGTKMFVIGQQTGNVVNEYTCTTGFDVSTCGFTDSFDASAQETTPTGIAFSADGLKMFVIGTAELDVNEYCLGIPFDVSSVCDIGVGGTALPIDTTALLVAGLYTNSLWIIPVIGGIAGLVIFTLKRNH